MAEANSPIGKVRTLQRKLYAAAKRNRDRIYRPDVLAEAWKQVRANKGAAGIDRETLVAVEAYGVERMLSEMRDLLESGRYRPQASRRVMIPKPGRPNERRPLSIPRVRDRVVQTAAKIVLEPIFEASFLDCSFGFRPKRRARDACEVVRKAVNNGMCHVVDIDFRNYFGTIDRDILLRLVARRVSDRRVLRLLRLMMNVGAMEDGVVVSESVGVPQGGAISPLLSNIYGHALDMLWTTEMSHVGTLVRFADDAVILCRTAEDAQRALEWLRGVSVGLKLTLHPEKTRVVDMREGREGFDFLGFHFHLVTSRKNGAQRWCLRWPSRRAMASIQGKVKAITSPRRVLPMPIEQIVRELNPVLRGWSNYFCWGNSSKKFALVDYYVHQRLALFDSKKRGRSGRRWLVHTHEWLKGLGVYRLTGRVQHA
jgi:group II intron reverse transcriptase/maturase